MIILQQGVFALMWGLLAVLHLGRRSAWRWSVGNLLVSAGLGLIAMRSDLPVWIGFWVSNALILVGMSLIRGGVEVFAKLRPDRREHVWLWVGSMSVLALVLHANSPWLVVVVTSLSLATASRGFGPLVLVPTAVAVNMLSFAMSESRRRRVAFVVIGTGIGIVAPVLLEALGILPPSYAFRDGVIQIMPQALSFTRGPALTVLLFANLAIIVAAAAWVGILRDELDRRDVELLLRKWHLAQMLPEEPSTADLRRKPEC